MSWFYLILAGMLEIGWPLGLKLAQQEGYRWHGFAAALACIVGSGYFLYLAQKSIPMGTAYAVWTGIGAAGAFLVGVVFFQRCRQHRPLARRDFSSSPASSVMETLQRKLKISFLSNPRPSKRACSDGLIPSRI